MITTIQHVSAKLPVQEISLTKIIQNVFLVRIKTAEPFDRHYVGKNSTMEEKGEVNQQITLLNKEKGLTKICLIAENQEEERVLNDPIVGQVSIEQDCELMILLTLKPDLTSEFEILHRDPVLCSTDSKELPKEEKEKQELPMTLVDPRFN